MSNMMRFTASKSHIMPILKQAGNIHLGFSVDVTFRVPDFKATSVQVV